MKNQFTLIILLIFCLTSSYAQTQKIEFNWNNNLVKPNTSLINLKLPVEFLFANNFNDSSIQFLDNEDITKVIALEGRKFGDSKLKLSGDNYFHIIIDDNGIIVGQDELPIPDQLRIKIANASSIPITLSKNEKRNSTETDEKYKPGYVYYDAIKLVQEQNDAIKFKILKSYGYTTTCSINLNPYLNGIINDPITINRTVKGGISSFGSLLTNLGNTDVTYFAAGLARFLAERTKEELNEAFFNKMKEQLNLYPELRTVFPKTTSFLNIIETYSYASVIQVLKEAFETDIQNLPENLYNLKDLTKNNCNECLGDKYEDCQIRLGHWEHFFKNTQEGLWIVLGMFSLKEGVQSTNPADLLKTITESTELLNIKKSSLENSKYDCYNIASSIELSNFISQSLISKDEKQIWITSAELNALFKIENGFETYLGLLLAKAQMNADKIEFYKTNNTLVKFEEILIAAKDNEEELKNLIKNSHIALNSANNAARKMIEANDKSIEVDPQSIYSYYRTFVSSLEPIVNNKFIKENIKDFNTEYLKVEQFLNPAVDIAYHISVKKYSAALYDAVILLNNTKTPALEKPVAKSFIKYGTLISTVANAQSSEEVKQAIDASVLPVGSSAIKRNSNLSIAINAYVGGYWTFKNSVVENDSIPIFGLMAPIGINFSKGFSKNGKWGGLSGNIQIIDLGALVNYYMINGDTSSLPNDFSVKLSNIFSPGFNLCYNIPKTPLSIAWGVQYIPTLYKYEQINGTNKLLSTNAWRWQLSFLVDIPMYNIKVWDF